VQKITENASAIYLFELSKVEFTSALWKKVRMGDIEQTVCEQVLKLFDDDTASYKWIVLDSQLADTAKKLFAKYGLVSLRTLDALQLAAALSVQQQADVFIINDDFLLSLFQQEGLNTEW
jgi:predicted nucleic acid-binding protein